MADEIEVDPREIYKQRTAALARAGDPEAMADLHYAWRTYDTYNEYLDYLMERWKEREARGDFKGQGATGA